MRNGQPEKKKPKRSVHDYKPKKRYTREEREKIELGMEFMEIIRKSLEKMEKNEQTENSIV